MTRHEAFEVLGCAYAEIGVEALRLRDGMPMDTPALAEAARKINRVLYEYEGPKVNDRKEK